MEALETGVLLLHLAYGRWAPSHGPINVCRTDLGQVGTWASGLKSFSK